MRNVILTGIPRSGTTLAAALVDSLPDCVCLNEPYWQTDAKLDGNAERLANWLKDDFARIRAHLLAEHPVPDRRQEDGKPLTDFFNAGQPQGKISLFIRAGLTDNFTLAMKHNALYLAALPQLARMKAFTIIALLRHPVDTIASWRRLSLPISSGRMPHAALYWPEVKILTENRDDVLTKQIKLYDLICQRLSALKETIHLVPYETLVINPDILCTHLGHDGPMAKELIHAREQPIAEKERSLITTALQTHGSHYQVFYPSL